MKNATNNSGRVQRRSIRVPLRVPLTILLAHRTEFDAEAVTVSRYGAKVRVGPYVRSLVAGDHVRVCHRSALSVRKARVAWIDRAGFCGLEVEDPSSFWGIYFPPPKAADEAPQREPYSPIAARNAS